MAEIKITLKRGSQTFKVGSVVRTIGVHHQGRRGLTGEQGEKGDTGEIGPQGLVGEVGPVGPMGQEGIKGDKGDKGEKGNQGIQGQTGAKGSKGDQGEPGPRGPQGFTGVQGNTGPQGEVGPIGPKGDPGIKGDPGLTGPEGPQGEQGEPGEDGSDGADADWSDIALAASKATPVDGDLIPILDSAASFGLKKLTWANLKATLFSADIQLPDGFNFLFGSGGASIGNNGERMVIDGGGSTLDLINTNEIFYDHATPTISLWNASDRTLFLTNDGGGDANLNVKSNIVAGENLSAANFSGSSSGVNTGDQTLPVKSTAAEIVTGTNDTKFNTPLGLRGAYVYPTLKARKMFYAYDDFVNNVNSPFFLSVSQNSGGVGLLASDGPKQIGISTLTTSTNAAGGAGIWSSQTNFVNFDTTVEWGFEAKIQIPTLSVLAERFQVWAGFIDNSFTEASDGAFFSYKDDVNGGEWELVTANGGSKTRTDSNVAPVAGSWVNLKVKVLNVGGTLTARFYINDVQVGGDITSNVPTGTARVGGYGVILLKTLGTTARLVYIDYQEIYAIPTTDR